MPGIPLLPPLTALVLHALWVLVLVLAIGLWRVSQVLGGQKRSMNFRRARSTAATPIGG